MLKSMMEKEVDYILDAYHPEKFRKEGHALVDLLADYLKKLEERKEDIKVLPHFSTDEAFSHWENELENPGTKSLTDLFSKVLNEGIHLHHPGYMGHQINPPAPSAAPS